MTRRRLLGLLSLAAGAPAAIGWWLWRQRRDSSELFRRFPAEHLLLAYLDVERLRRARALAPLLRSTVEPDSDYNAFVKQTGFDYQRDLDAAAVCYLADRAYIVARGRFDFERLRQYAVSQGGSCDGASLERPCRMPGSRPLRKISFVSPASGVLRMATAPEADAVSRLENASGLTAEPLARSVAKMHPERTFLWATATPASLDRLVAGAQGLSPNLTLFSKALAEAQRAYLFLAEHSSGLQISLEAVCSTEEQAARMWRLLQGLHDLIGSLMRQARGKNPPDEWEKVVASAAVQQEKQTARVIWTLGPAALESLGKP